MEQQLIFSSPIHQSLDYYGIDDRGSNMVVSDECECDIAKVVAAVDASSSSTSSSSSSAMSPTCVVFAVDERLSDVFRMPVGHAAAAAAAADEVKDILLEEDERGGRLPFLNRDHQGVDEMAALGVDNDVGPLLLRPSRCLTPSFATEEELELSTFSEDTEESSSSSSSLSGYDQHHRHRHYPPLRIRRTGTAPSLMSIFRPSTRGTKRRCDFEDEDGEDRHEYYHRRRSSSSSYEEEEDDGCGPSLRRANPVGSGECRYNNDGNDAEISLSSTYSFASAFKRICRSGSAASSSISMSVVVSEEGGDAPFIAVQPTMTILERLQHPLSSPMDATSEDVEFHRFHESDDEDI